MPRLTVSLLGAPLVERDGTPIQVDTRKAIALLAYLAVTGQAHNRDTLAALLWPEYDQASARASLRRTLSALKRGLGDDVDWLHVERERLALRPGPDVWIDVQEFRARLAETAQHGHPARIACPACVEPITRAVELYRGEFLAGFALRESATFDDWQLYEADALRREISDALERLVVALSMQQDFPRAISHARRWLSLDPLHEPAHRQLMLLYAWAGDRGQALRQYRECARTLDKELGVAPLAETTQLAEAIKEDRGPAPPVAAAGPPVQDQAETPRQRLPGPQRYALVGRHTEWAALLEAYAAPSADGRLVVLEGEAGIGKTRLAEEVLDYAAARGAMVLAVRCYEGQAGLAYGPFADALRAVIARGGARVERLPDHWLAEAARLVPELVTLRPGLRPPAEPPAPDPGAQGRFLEGLSQVLLAAAGLSPPAEPKPGRPGEASAPRPVLFVDDLHWADVASLDLLTYLVRRLRGRPLLLVATWRTEMVPQAHRLRRLLAEALRDGCASQVVLGRLSPSEVAELVRQARPRAANLGESLYRDTEGVPFFLVEYLRALSGGAMQPAADGRPPLPGGVRELLRARLADVGETATQLLAAAAVMGRSFDFETLREASGRSEDETLAALEELLGRGLVREVPGAALPTFDFTHERLREVLLEELSLLRRRLLHRRLAEALARRARGPRAEPGPLAAAVAAHYQAAGDDAEAAGYFRLAGEHARRLFANAEALDHFRAALALGNADRAALHEAIGDLQTLAGDYAAAQASYEVAAAECGPGQLAAIEHKLGELYARHGEWELAESHFEAALEALGQRGPAGPRARVYADWSLLAHRRGQAERALELAQQARELAEAASDPRALAQAHNMLGMLARDRGEPGAARQHLERSLALADMVGDPAARAAALNNLALAHAADGQVERAISLFEAALALCLAQGDRHRAAALHNNLADLLHAAGRGAEAMDHLKQAVALFAEVGAEPGSLAPAEVWKLTAW